MTNLAKQEFVPLAVSGENYISWARDVKMYLASMGLGDTIVKGKDTTGQEQAKAMIFICHHIDESLKWQYVTLENPRELWEKLKERYENMKTIVLPNARNEWHNLRLQDFKTVQDYNSAMFKITSQLRLCGENITESDMLEKTFSTFHATNMLLQQQYREKGFTKYSDLITCLLLAEKKNELLLKNHESRPPCARPFPEVNAAHAENPKRDHRSARNQYVDRNRDRRQNRAEPYRHNNYQNKPRNESDRRYDDKRPYKPRQRFNARKSNYYDEKCSRCGIKGNWARICRTADHLAALYQASKEGKGKAKIETNHADHDDTFDDVLKNDITHLDAEDFVEHNNSAN